MKTSESALRQMLLEIALGADPTAGKSKRDEKVPGHQTTGVVVPISPSLESPIQLSVQTPPISDPDFSPANKFELARAMSAIGELVPDESASDFFEKVKDLYTEFTGNEIA